MSSCVRVLAFRGQSRCLIIGPTSMSLSLVKVGHGEVRAARTYAPARFPIADGAVSSPFNTRVIATMVFQFRVVAAPSKRVSILPNFIEAGRGQAVVEAGH